MKLTILGNNGPFPAPGGACSGYLLQGGGVRVVMDLGSGALANLMAALDGDLELVDAIILTHLHADHMSDISVLRYALDKLLKGKASGKDGKPRLLPLHCPPAPEPEYAALKSYAQFEVRALSDKTAFNVGGLSFSFMPTTHPYPTFAVSAVEEGPSRPPVAQAQPPGAQAQPPGAQAQPPGALTQPPGAQQPEARQPEARQSGAHAKLVYTGDTSWNLGIMQFAEKADILLADACHLSRDKLPGKPIFHMTADECGIAAAEADAKRLLLTHFTPGSDPMRHVAEAKAGIQKVSGRKDHIGVEPARIMSTYDIP